MSNPTRVTIGYWDGNRTNRDAYKVTHPDGVVGVNKALAEARAMGEFAAFDWETTSDDGPVTCLLSFNPDWVIFTLGVKP